MRLDKYLKVSRLIKRRTVANEACDAGYVSVNGRTARASLDVAPGDIIEIAFGMRGLRVRAVRTDGVATKESAGEMYETLEERILSPDDGKRREEE